MRDHWIDTETAEFYTGRSKWVLYRWRREDRVQTIKDERSRQLLWRVEDLPARQRDGSLPPWPRKKS